MMAAGEKEGSDEDLQMTMAMKMGCCPSGYNALNVNPMALSSDLENEPQDAGALFVLESKGVYFSFIRSFSTLAILPILLGVPGLLVHFCGIHRPSALCTLIGNVAIYIVMD